MKNHAEVQVDHGPHGSEPIIIKLVIDLEDHCVNDKPHPDYDPGVVLHYLIKVNDRKHETPDDHMLGKKIIKLAGQSSDDFLLYQIRRKHGVDYEEPVGEDELVDFTAQDIERFITKPRTYHFSIGKKRYESGQRYLTVRQILVDFAHVADVSTHTLASSANQHEYKNLDEKIDLKCVSSFVLFNDQPTPVS